MKRIAIFQSDLHVGGIQRSLVNLLRNLGKEDISVDVFLFDNTNIFYELDFADNIHLHFLEKLPYWNRFLYFEIVKKLWTKKLLNRIEAELAASNPANESQRGILPFYDIAIDFNSYWNECALGALSIPAKKRAMWIHNDVVIKSQNEYKYRIIHHFFKGKYKNYDIFVPVSKGIQMPFIQLNQIKQKSFTVIPNHIDTEEIRRKLAQPVSMELQEKLGLQQAKVNVVSVGRLCHQKGYDLLLEVVEQVVQKRQDIHFYMIGDGPDYEKLQQEVRNRALAEYVTFLGNQSNPFPIMKCMDAFFMMSRYEGQPLAFWEAKAVGLPVIIPKHLEQYTEGIPGQENVVQSLLAAQKHSPEFDPLEDYNAAIRRKIHELIYEDSNAR